MLRVTRSHKRDKRESAFNELVMILVRLVKNKLMMLSSCERRVGDFENRSLNAQQSRIADQPAGVAVQRLKWL